MPKYFDYKLAAASRSRRDKRTSR